MRLWKQTRTVWANEGKAEGGEQPAQPQQQQGGGGGGRSYGPDPASIVDIGAKMDPGGLGTEGPGSPGINEQGLLDALRELPSEQE